MFVACNLRAARGKRTVAEMARATGVAAAYLSQIETGRLLPRDEWIAPMEAAYGLGFESWYGPRTLLALQEDEAA